MIAIDHNGRGMLWQGNLNNTIFNKYMKMKSIFEGDRWTLAATCIFMKRKFSRGILLGNFNILDSLSKWKVREDKVIDEKK